MKRIVNYKTFINESSVENNLTTEQIDFLNNYVRGKWKLNAEGVVDVDGNIHCFNKGISDFKGIKFGKVSGDFDCSYNNLTSLEGCPKEVSGHFYCYDNNLTSLEGCPKEVGGGFYCHYNSLTSLEFGPEAVNGDFICYDNNLTSLEGCPEKVNGDFDCGYNKLISLEGCPKEVGGHFYCHYNNLTSLEGAPKEVGGTLRCFYNEGLSAETIGLIFDKMGKIKLDYSDALKSLWSEIPIEDKILLCTSDLDWIDPEEVSKLYNLKKYYNIKKMI